MDEQSFGRRLRRVRRARDLTQHQLAALAGVHVSSIAKLESGATDHAKDDTVRAMAVALGVSADYLLGLTNDSGVERPGEAATADGALQGASAVADVALVQDATLGASVAQEEGEEVYATSRDERGTAVARTARSEGP